MRVFARGVITNNLGLKVAALIVAIVIWLFAKGEEAANRHFSVPLVLRNIPEGVTTVERPPETVDVIFTGANKELLKLRLWGEPCAVIDMTGAAAGRGPVEGVCRGRSAGAGGGGRGPGRLPVHR